MDLGLPLIVAFVLAFVAFLIWNRTRAIIDRRRLHLDTQARLLEQLGSGPALTEFLKTTEGQKFWSDLNAPPVERPRHMEVGRRILLMTTLGLVALFGGLVLVAAALLPNLLVDEPAMPFDIIALGALPAFLLTGAGVGALVAAWLTNRLSKRWGILRTAAADRAGD